MACDPHPLVLSPCADDTVSVAQSLGTRGDVSFDEYGSAPLTAGQSEAVVSFNYEKVSAAYVFEYLYVKCPDSLPGTFNVIPNNQTTTSFRVEFSGDPISANSILYWHVVVPDPLVACQPSVNAPHYAIVRTEQHGIAPLLAGQDYVSITFPQSMPDNNWGFEQFSIEKAITDSETQVFSWTVTVHAMTGFIVQLSGNPDDNDYSLRWQVR